MKCYACGYEKKSLHVNDNKIIRYKSGKHKGEIKETIEGNRDVFENDPKFNEIFIGNDSMNFTKNREDSWMDEKESVTVYACPNCGTLKIQTY